MDPQASIVEQDGQVAADLGAQGEPHKPRRRKLVVTLTIVGVLAVLGLATGAGLLVARLVQSGGQAAGEWEERVSADYPGWHMVGFNVSSFSGPSGSETDYTITMVPPDREFSLGIVYKSTDGDEAVCTDDVFRPGSRHSDGADSLLDYIERTHVADGKKIVSVTSDSDGSVTIEWLRARSFLIFSSRVGSFEVLEYDSDRDTWNVTFSPDDLGL